MDSALDKRSRGDDDGPQQDPAGHQEGLHCTEKVVAISAGIRMDPRSPGVHLVPAADRTSLESAARTALESRVGHAFSDLEWSRIAKKLVEFTVILRAWDQGLTGKEAADELESGDRKAA